MRLFTRPKRASTTGMAVVLWASLTCSAQTPAAAIDARNDPRNSAPRTNDPRSNDPRSNDPRSNDPRTNSPQNQALQERVERLATSLESAQSQVDRLRGEVEALRKELSEAKTGASSPASTAQASSASQEEALSRVKEDQDVLAAEVKQHEQTKVESESRFPVRITGLVLFNAFVDQGVIDEIDLPTAALRRPAGLSHGSVGGSIRQTWLGLEGQGPVLGSMRTSARVSLDFFGGTSGGLTSGSTGIVRLRTAAVRAETDSNVFEARLDEPLISPLSPATFASVAQPGLAWTGNLWTWAPELRWQHRFGSGQGRTFETELGLRDPYLAGTQAYQEMRVPSPAELARRPAVEARFSYGSGAISSGRLSSYTDAAVTGWRLGGGGYYAKQDYASGIGIDTWAVTADWQLPLGRWVRLSGEAYRGTGLGGLGGGAYRDVVQGLDRVTGASRTLGLDTGGGWTQLQFNPSSRLQLNAAFGQDAGSGSQLRLLILPSPSSALGFYARNRAFTGNIIYRPWRSLIVSPEYRRIISWPITGLHNTANIFTVSAGYQF